jgi:hypothetical protein
MLLLLRAAQRAAARHGGADSTENSRTLYGLRSNTAIGGGPLAPLLLVLLLWERQGRASRRCGQRCGGAPNMVLAVIGTGATRGAAGSTAWEPSCKGFDSKSSKKWRERRSPRSPPSPAARSRRDINIAVRLSTAISLCTLLCRRTARTCRGAFVRSFGRVCKEDEKRKKN